MAITFRAVGTPVFGVNSFSVGIPASAAAGDMMLLLVSGKPYNATISASTGWTFLNDYTNGTVGAGVDVGSMEVSVWYKEHDGSESNPTLTEGSTTWNVLGAVIVVWQKGAGDTWDTPAIAGGGDASAGTGFSVTTEANPGITTGDVVTTFGGFRSDAATPLSVHLTQTATGVTFTNTHVLTDPETTTGGDMGMCVNRATVSGTATAAPVISGTLAASHTGSAMLVRLRVTSAGNPSGDAALTGAAVAVSGSGKAIRKGSGSIPDVAVAVSGSGTRVFRGDAAFGIDVAISTTGTRVVKGSAAVPDLVVSLSATGKLGVPKGDAALAIGEVVVSATGAKTVKGESAAVVTVSVAGTGEEIAPIGAATTVSVTISASGSTESYGPLDVSSSHRFGAFSRPPGFGRLMSWRYGGGRRPRAMRH